MIETIKFFGSEISLYYLFWFIGAMSVIVGGYILGKHYGFPFSRSVLYVAGAVAMGYVLLYLTSVVFNGGKVGGLNFVRVVTFLPVPIWIRTFIYKDSFGDIADFLAPLVAIYHGVTHIGCIFPGCCHGYPAQWGLYSNKAEAVCFPIQPIEAASSILIGVILIIMQKKNIQKGRLYPLYMFLFGGTRFVWEFLRDNVKIWNGVSELAIHALTAMILGVIALAIANCFYKRRNSKYEEN